MGKKSSEENRIYHRAYYAENKQKIKERRIKKSSNYYKIQYIKNKQYYQSYYLLNKEKCDESNARYRQNNVMLLRKKSKIYNENRQKLKSMRVKQIIAVQVPVDLYPITYDENGLIVYNLDDFNV